MRSYLDDDLESGYVRTLMELWAARWSVLEIANPVRDNLPRLDGATDQSGATSGKGARPVRSLRP